MNVLEPAQEAQMQQSQNLMDEKDEKDLAGASAFSMNPNPIFPKSQDLAPDFPSHSNDAVPIDQDLGSYISLPSVQISERGDIEIVPGSCWTRFQQASIPVLLQSSVSLGVGVFVVPKLYIIIGFIPGTILLFCFGVMSYYAQCLCIDCTVINATLNSISNIEATNCKSEYVSLARQVFYKDSKCGKFAPIMTGVSLIIALFVANCVHIDNGAALMHDIVEYFFTNDIGNYPFTDIKYAITYFFMLFFTLRWIFAKDLNGLWKLGVISTVVVVITSTCLIVVLIVYGTNGDDLKDEWDNGTLVHILGYKRMINPEFWVKDIWKTAPDFAFMFMGSLFLFPMHNEMLNRNVVKTKAAVLRSTIVTLLCLFFVSIAVMCVYGVNTTTNVLYNAIRMYHTLFCFCIFALVSLICFFLSVLGVSLNLRKILQKNPQNFLSLFPRVVNLTRDFYAMHCCFFFFSTYK